MSAREALLIGASIYGDGFAQLPAVATDLVIMRTAFEKAGFNCSIATEDEVGNAADLERKIRDFCRAGSKEDIRVLYFSGHGLRIDGKDWILPAKTSRIEAMESASLRVASDLTRVVQRSQNKLVIFIIDACRDSDDVQVRKGGAGGWGSSASLDVDERRFVRFLGCKEGEYCQVLPKGHDSKDVSLFSKAIYDELTMGEGPCSLKDLLAGVEMRCRVLANGEHVRLKIQKPRLSHAEVTGKTYGLLEEPVFERIGKGVSGGTDHKFSDWQRFGPEKLHCAVVVSEYCQGTEGEPDLSDIVEAILSSAKIAKIWKDFRECWQDRPLASGVTRQLPESVERGSVRQARCPVTQCFTDEARISEVVRMIVEADLAVFDVTRFEPGVMFLLGVRGATRRGLTICSHAAGWLEGEPLTTTPFNLRDINLNSHTIRSYGAGENPVEERLAERIATGFRQFRSQPRYLDLPIFDSLRALGLEEDANATIDIDKEIIMLCSYDKDYFSIWNKLRGKISKALSQHAKWPQIHRLIDIASPQLVSQHLYERVRRAAGCLADWSFYSPSSFLELGARLAVSEWGAVQIIGSTWCPGAEGADTKSLAFRSQSLRQVVDMKSHFEPVVYSMAERTDDVFDEIAGALVARRKQTEAPPDRNIVYQAVSNAIGMVEPAHPTVYEQFEDIADSLSSGDERRNAPQQIYLDYRIKEHAERTAMEYRLAAWLYLDNRVGAGTLPKGDPLRERYERLGRATADALFATETKANVELAIMIEGKIRA